MNGLMTRSPEGERDKVRDGASKVQGKQDKVQGATSNDKIQGRASKKSPGWGERRQMGGKRETDGGERKTDGASGKQMERKQETDVILQKTSKRETNSLLGS